MTDPAPSVFDRLVLPASATRTEADIQSDVKILLLNKAFGLSAPALEEPIKDGSKRRIDVALGATVIEVKKALTDETAATTYIDQLMGYVETKTQLEDSRYNGILTDGRKWWLYEIDPSSHDFLRRSTFELTSPSQGNDLIGWLQAVLATHTNVKPTKETIERFLGSSSPAYAQDIAYLQGLYRTVEDDPTVDLKRQLWARLLRSALGTSFTDDEQLFFAHTLLVIEAAAIGHSVMGVSLSDLVADPDLLMSGEAFSNAGIHNVIEADFFDWVLATHEGRRFISRIIHRIGVFNWDHTEHDVLKVLYESIIRPETRKKLGEYYTPDWLAEGIVAKTVTDPLTQRVLDPACGSGTFPFHVIRLMLKAAAAEGWDNRKILNHLQQHVYGLDIHPVSVLLARITYLLALGDRLREERDDIWVPIHLGDSLQWHQPADHDEDAIHIRTDGDDLTAGNSTLELFQLASTLVFPLSSIDDPGTFDRLVTDMTNLAKLHTDATQKRPSVQGILTQYGIPDGADSEVLTSTFNLLCDLVATGRDSIWGYFVRNQVRPLWLSMPGRRVDVLVGNPPWVAYRHMTPEMQSTFKTMSEHRDLWHGAQVATQQDLVGLFIARAAEKYLDDGGTFGFVVPLAVLSRKQYDGFRTGKWGPVVRGNITELWDLDQVRPSGFFPVPSAAVFGTRNSNKIGINTEQAAFGFALTKHVFEGLRDTRGWEQSLNAFTVAETPYKQIRIDAAEIISPYRANTLNGATIFPRSLFFITEETSQNALGTTAGKTQARSMRTAQEKAPWKNLPALGGVIENSYIFDVHLGSTIVPFRTLQPWKAVLPISKNQLLSEEAAASHAGGLGNWWRTAAERWEQNKTRQSKLSLMGNLDFQNKLTKQLGGAKHRVVYTKSGNTLAAARLANPHVIIDHKLYWIPARNETEAGYLTAVLNAPAFTAAVSEYQSRGLFGARDFDMYVWRLPVPTFDATVDLHNELAQIATEAEAVAAELELSDIGFQQARKLVRTALNEQGISNRLDTAVKVLLNMDDIK